MPDAANVEKAVLRLWVAAVLTPGIEVLPVVDPWQEASIMANSSPSLGSAITSFSVASADGLHSINVDVTALVRDWVSGNLANNGLALVGSGAVNVVFDTKESIVFSHSPELEVALVSGARPARKGHRDRKGNRVSRATKAIPDSRALREACLPCCARPVRRYRVSTPMARPSACRFPAHRPALAPTITTVDSVGDVGERTSITIGADGFGLISYYDATNSALKVAHCNDTRCTAPTTTTLDDSVGVVTDTSITIGGIDDLGLISYYDAVHALLKVAHCTNPACTSATITTLDTSSEGYYASITTGADGLGLISYQDLTAKALGMAHTDNPACTTATITRLDSATGTSGRFTSPRSAPMALG